MKKVDKLRNYLIENRTKTSFQTTGFFIEFIENRFQVEQDEAVEIANQLIKEGFIEKQEKVCSVCKKEIVDIANQQTEAYCINCEEITQLSDDFYRTILTDRKLCVISNKQFSWEMKVDGESILFQGSENAKYFQNHYEELGYVVEMNK